VQDHARGVDDAPESAVGEQSGGRIDDGLLRDFRFLARGDPAPQVVERLADGRRRSGPAMMTGERQSRRVAHNGVHGGEAPEQLPFPHLHHAPLSITRRIGAVLRAQALC
jgi:hypothetical protein